MGGLGAGLGLLLRAMRNADLPAADALLAA